MEPYILKMSGICKSFNGVQVLKDTHLEVLPGEVHVLLGENGAGKSTMIKILSAAYKKDKGDIFLDGEKLNITTPREALNRGISVIYQEFNLNPYVTIYENICLGREFITRGLVDKKKAIAYAKEHLEMIGLNIDPSTLVGKLSVAQKQMVEIAKALSSDVKILVLDEPTAAITDKEVNKLFTIIRDLKKKKIGVIYISHRMGEIFEIGDRCTVMRDGETIQTMQLSETTVNEITKMMVGRNVEFSKIENPHVDASVTALEVEGLNYKDFLKDVGFHLQKGEILGIAGLVGAGRTEVAKCILGAYKKSSGMITCKNGSVLLKGKLKETIANGIVYLSEDRKDEGLVLIHSVAGNIVLPNLGLFGKIILRNKEMPKFVEGYVEKLRIKTSSQQQAAKNLSGGNQQKVVIAKWLARQASVYIFDEPTRGIDVGARSEIYDIMLEIVAGGGSIIMISSDLVEVLKMCNRVLVMHEGTVSEILDNDGNLTQEQILMCAIGENRLKGAG